MQATIAQQKTVSSFFLREFSDHLKSEVYLAGGMIRDHFLGQSGNDFDLYVQAKPDFDYESFMLPLLNGMAGFSNFKELSPTGKAVASGYTSKAILSVFEGTYSMWGSKHHVQLIVLKIKPRMYIEEHFCCSLSKCWQTSGSDPLFAMCFLNTITSKEIKFNFSKVDAINYDYMDKILNRYPAFGVDAKTKEYYLDRMHKKACYT